MIAESKIGKRHQTVVPREVRKLKGFEEGQSLLWIIDEVSGDVRVIPKPRDYTAFLRGLGKEVWAGIDVDAYLEGERNSWDR